MGGCSGMDLKGFQMQLAKVAVMALLANVANAYAAMVVVSGGASMLQSTTGEERRLSSLRVDCASHNRTNVGFLCAFDDGQNTILQFENRDGMPVRLYDPEGHEIIGVRRVGSYHVLPQLYSTVFARVGGKEAAIVRNTLDGKTVSKAGDRAPETSTFAVVPGAERSGNDAVKDRNVATNVEPANVNRATANAQTADARTSVAAKVVVPSVPTPAPAPLPKWTLTAGRTIGQELQNWGTKAGWKVIWTMQKDWAVPASTVFTGEFKTAASDVINNLASNGALIRAQFYDGNRTLVIGGPGVAQK
jgi:hypothetical protein